MSLRIRRGEVVGLGLLMVVGLVTQIYRFNFPVSTSGPIGTWRRTQTAWGIRSMMRGSLNPFEAQVPVLGPPWKLPFEFPLYQWVAAVVGRISGLDAVVAGRLVNALSLIVTGALTYVLGARLVSRTVGGVAATVVVLSPYGIHWGGDIAVEYFTVALCLAAFLAFTGWLANGRVGALAGFLGLASLAALSKTTSLVPWIVGMALMVIGSRRTVPWSTSVRRLAVLAVPMLLGLGWTRWADAVKADNPHSAPFVTSRMWSHNFGRLADRAEMSTWQFFFRNVFDTTVGGVVVATGLIVLAMSRRNARREVSLMGAVALTGPAVFASLYWAHPYYAIAVMPALVVVLGSGLVFGIERLFADSSIRARTAAVVASTAGVLVLAATTAEGVELMNATLLRNRGAIVTYDDIAEHTSADDALLVVSNAGWDPTLSFVADRRMLMLFPSSDPNATRPDESELGTTYRFAYWMGDAPDPEQWKDYLPSSIRLEPLSSNLFRIVPASVG